LAEAGTVALEAASPNNCDVVTLAERQQLKAPLFTSGRWASRGCANVRVFLRRRALAYAR